MGQKRKRYTDEFKVEAVRLLIDSGKPVSVIAKELGVSEYLLTRWKHAIQSDAHIGGKSVLSRDEEIHKLRRELKRVTDECKYLNNIVEQDHRRIKRRIRPMLGFQRFRTASIILGGIELVHMLRKGQLRNPGRSASLARQFNSLVMT